MITRFTILALFFGFILSASAQQNTAPKKLTIIHTNDLQSILLGVGPNAEYTPMTTGDDRTIGGIARLATVIKKMKSEAPEQTLVLDGGDVLMGSLFHTIVREEGGEFRLFAEIGYDAAVLGNHEFDFGPQGLARIIRSGSQKGSLPQLLIANAIFDQNDARDDELKRIFDEGLIRPYKVFVRKGLKIGVFGLLGKDAAEVAPFSRPVAFTDPIEAAKAMTKKLRDGEQVDLVIAVSHSGVRKRPGETEFHGEDIELARQVPDIDVVISGHSHTLLQEPIFVNNTPIVQAGDHGQHVGVLELEIAEGQVSVRDYKIVDIDDQILGDAQIQAEVERLKSVVTDSILAPFGYSFSQPLAETDFDLMIEQRESNLGNLVADAIRWGIDRTEEKNGNAHSKLDIAIEANGQIRDHIFKGQSGIQHVSDLFRPVGLGIGVVEDTPGYPLVKFYVTAQEIKKALEVLTTVHPLKGPSYYLQVSGLRFRYNPNRLMFDRVIEIEIESENGEFVTLDFSASNKRLYSIGTNFYVASFIKLIGSFTYGILEIVPKNEQGNPIENMREALIDADSKRDGVQELKEWVVFLDYVRSFEDIDGNGLANIPEKYRSPEGRIVEVKSWHPVLLFKNATYLTWSVTALALVFFAGFCITAWVVVRKLKR